ncbi:diaminobutyrate acetyltransferase [Streptomyces sp. NPDC007088]|uniref:diaminobutyrate acetyltransferase n=1 Tax=Streptomyces sp. NPDC007088 TaxID=3364773 RepID=UPI0036C7039A
MGDLDATQVILRAPRLADAPAVCRMVHESDILDSNSLYYYNLWFRDFANTSVVAVADDDELVGFVTAYVRPSRPDTLMAWQSAVEPRRSFPGLAVRMMHDLADRAAGHGATCIETTVNPENRAVALMLRKFARERGLDVQTEVLFSAEDFPDDAQHSHPPEILYRMTPTAPLASAGQSRPDVVSFVGLPE